MSVDFTAATAFQDYIREYHDDLLSLLYHEFKTGSLITPHEGVKGELVLTEMQLGNLVKRHAIPFDPTNNALSFNPRVLTVHGAKVDLQIAPQEYESNYLGAKRSSGFQPDFLPYEGFTLAQIIKKVAAEQEIAIWQAVKTGSATTDPLTSLFDGFLKIIADAITATTLTPITTAAHTSSNAVANAEAVHAGLDPVYQLEETYMFCSVAFARLYNLNYRADYGKYPGVEKRGAMDMIRLDFGNCWLVPTIGMGTSSRLICTPPLNMHHGYDAAGDSQFLRVEKYHRALDIMMDFKMGAQIGILNDKIIRVNNLA